MKTGAGDSIAILLISTLERKALVG